MTDPPYNTDKPIVHALRADDYWLGESTHVSQDARDRRAMEDLERLIALAKRGERQSMQPVERGTAQQAAAMLGLKPRKLQTMSVHGDIPGAAKLGRLWTYDLAKLRQFIDQQEKITCQGSAKRPPDATGAAISSGRKLEGVGVSSAGRLRQMIQQSQKRVAKQARRGR